MYHWIRILAEMIKRNSECVQLTSAPNSTPLHLAAFEGHPKAVRVILGSPCTPNVNARLVTEQQICVSLAQPLFSAMYAV